MAWHVIDTIHRNYDQQHNMKWAKQEFKIKKKERERNVNKHRILLLKSTKTNNISFKSESKLVI